MYKVLIIEDEEMIRKGLIYTYEWEEQDLIVVGEAANGIEGLEKIESLKPDIVIVDVNMPIMTGIEMLEKSVDKYIFSAIILSGYAEFSLAKKAVHLDVAEYLLKPVDTEQLKIALEKAKEQVELRKQAKIIKEEYKDIDEFSCLKPNLIKDKKKTSKYVLKMI
ncbi:response regulator, partial [Clostridium perfringens]